MENLFFVLLKANSGPVVNNMASVNLAQRECVRIYVGIFCSATCLTTVAAVILDPIII